MRIIPAPLREVATGDLFSDRRSSKIFTREIMIPVSYTDDRAKVEEILLDVGRQHSVQVSQVGHEALTRMRTRYFVKDAQFEPRVYLRITDNWVELTLRFVVNERGVREVKDQMNREILSALEDAKIGIASSTYDIVGLPPIRVIAEPPAANR